jgi:hypothetical protein
MRAHRNSSSSANAVRSIPKRVDAVVGVAIEQLSIGTTVSDGTIAVRSCHEFAKAQAPHQA